MDYKATLNLPKSGLPMKANLPKREPQILEFWREMDLYATVQRAREGRPKYILHDGPPYANGNIHLGQALNKILKDITVKFKTMQGFDCPFVPGWDTHGLPTEHQVLKQGLKREALDVLEWRKRCYEFASKFVDLQREQFVRLGVRADWENPYITYQPEYEATELEIFAKLVEKGLVYRALRSVYWCGSCKTALAEAEIEYQEDSSPSIYVDFELVEGIEKIAPELAGESVQVTIWTTTPWTLPANVGIMVHPDYKYQVVRCPDGKLRLLAAERVQAVAEEIGWDEYKVVVEAQGKALEGLKAQHPFMERTSQVVLAEYVTLEEGTGCVHTAPGHGREDFEVGQRYGLPVLCPVDDTAILTDEAGPYAGLKVWDANPKIIADLKASGALVFASETVHQYPHCWRCKQPIVYRATKQWFLNVDALRAQCLDAVDQVDWLPEYSRNRIKGMLESAPDWCLSRQRVWGVPLPVFYCKQCGEPLLDKFSLEKVIAIVRERGADAWYELPVEELLPAKAACSKCGGTEFFKEKDIIDVWFDSGCSHTCVLRQRPELAYPADLYLEGSDQHRGWFQTSLKVAIGYDGSAPYKKVLTHGFFVDEAGRKMSKSLGNVVDPLEVCEQYGADILRLWCTYVDFKQDMHVSGRIFQQVSEAYRRLRNTFRFILGNLEDFDPATDYVPWEHLYEFDQYALARLQRLIRRVTQAMEEWDYHLATTELHNFCATFLSSLYLDVSKDHLYVEAKDSMRRRSTQTTLYELLKALLAMVTPILAFTSEEIWQTMPEALKPGQQPTVQLLPWPTPQAAFEQRKLLEKWEAIMAVREDVMRALDYAVREEIVPRPLAAEVRLKAGQARYDLLKELGEELRALLIVSKVELEFRSDLPADAVTVEVGPAPGEKCERCWLVDESVGENPDHPGLCARCVQLVKSALEAESEE